MNKGQFRVICGGIVVVVLAGAFPAWVQTYSDKSVHIEQAVGYAPIFAPPKPLDWGYGVRLDIPRLLLTWCVVGAATFGLWWWMGRRVELTEEQRWPWKSIARWLYTWCVWSWLTVILGTMMLLKTMMDISQAGNNLPQHIQLWLIFDVMAHLIVFVLYFFATINFAKQPAYASKYFHAAYIGLSGLGFLGLLTVMAIFPKDMWPALYANNAVQILVGLFFLWVIRPMRLARFQEFYRVLDHLHHFGVPTTCIAPAMGVSLPASPHPTQPTCPRKKIGPVRLLRAITVGQVVVPSNV
ncbi:hypothetical protein HED60_18025 [Planctomycetales bacterium ZRK34]|nr:hypothetical protein HED60_18025 [Planctomycetales bacterium ZRK34]